MLGFSKRKLFRSWLALFPAFFVLWYFPYINFPIRVLTWTAAITILVGAIWFSRRLPFLPWVLIILYGGVIFFFLLPTHQPADRSALQSSYCSALTAYSNCPYVWGGEGYLGIDCSGLVRKGMEDALAMQGISTFNPMLSREALSLYWHDTNAKTIGEGYEGRTRFITTCPDLNHLHYVMVQPGDLAVTEGGDHIMAYLGDKKWIAADPIAGKVTTFTVPEQRNPYFSTPMRIVR